MSTNSDLTLRTDLIRVRLHSSLAVPVAYITFQDTKQSAQAWKRQAIAKLSLRFQCELTPEECVFVDATSGVIPDTVELNGTEMRLLTLMQLKAQVGLENGKIRGRAMTVHSSDDRSRESEVEVPPEFGTPLTHTSRRLDPELKEDFTAKLGQDFIQRLKSAEDGELITQTKTLVALHSIIKGGYMTRRHGFSKKRRYCALLGGRLVVSRMKATQFSVELILNLEGAHLKSIGEDKDTTFVISTLDKKEYTFIAPDYEWYQQLEKVILDRSSSSVRSTKSQVTATILTGFDALEGEVLSWLQAHDLADSLERQLSKVTSIVLLLLDLDTKQSNAAELLRTALVSFTPPVGLQALVDWKWENQKDEELQALLETMNKDNPTHKLTLEELKPLWARARLHLDPSLGVPLSNMTFSATKRQSVRAWKQEAITKLNAKFMGGLDPNECTIVGPNSRVLADSVDLAGLDLFGLSLVTLPKIKSTFRGARTVEVEVSLWLEHHDLAADLSSSLPKVVSVVLLLLQLDPRTVTCDVLHAQLATFGPPLCLKALVEWKPKDVEVVEKEEILALLEVLNLDATRKLTYDELKPLLAQLTQSKQDDLVRVRLDENLAVPIAYITCSVKKTQSAQAWKCDVIQKLTGKYGAEIDPKDCLFVNSQNKPLDDEMMLHGADLKELTLSKTKEEPKVSADAFRLGPKDSAQLAQASRTDIQALLHTLSTGSWSRLIFCGLDPIAQIEALQHPIMPDCDPLAKQGVALSDVIKIMVASLPGSAKMEQLAEDIEHLDANQPIRQLEILLDLFMALQDSDLKCRCDSERKSIPVGTNGCMLLVMHQFLSVGGIDSLLELMLSWTGMAEFEAGFEWIIKIIWLLELAQTKEISCAGAIELDLDPPDDCWWQENALSKCVGLLEDPPLTVFVALFEIANEKLETFRDRKAGYEALVKIQSFRDVRVFKVMEIGWKNARFSVLEQCLEYIVCCQSQKKNICYLLSDPLWYRYFIPLLLNGGAQSSFNINARSMNGAEAEAKVENVLKLVVSTCVGVLHGAYLGLGDSPNPVPPEEVGKPIFSTLMLSFFDAVEEIALWTPDTVMVTRLLLQSLLTKCGRSLTSFCHDPISITWEYFFQLCSVLENFVYYSPLLDSPLRSIDERRFTHLGLHHHDDVILVELLLECMNGLKLDSLFAGGFDPLVKKLCTKIVQRVQEEQEFWRATLDVLRLANTMDEKALEKSKAFKTCEAALKQRRSRSKVVKKHAALEARRIRRALLIPAMRKVKEPEPLQKSGKQGNEQTFWKLHGEALISAQLAREQRAQQFLNKTLLSRSRPFPKPDDVGSKALAERKPPIRRATVITPSQEELKLEREILRVRARRGSMTDLDDEPESTWQEVRNLGISILEKRGSFSLARNSGGVETTPQGRTRGLSLLRRNSNDTSRVLEFRRSLTHRNSGIEIPRVVVNDDSGRRASKSSTPTPPLGFLNSVRRSISYSPDAGAPINHIVPHTVAVSLAGSFSSSPSSSLRQFSTPSPSSSQPPSPNTPKLSPDEPIPLTLESGTPKLTPRTSPSLGIPLQRKASSRLRSFFSDDETDAGAPT